MKTALFVMYMFLFMFVFLGTNITTAAAPEGLDSNAIDDYIEREMRASRIPGLALGIIQDGEITYLQGYGSAGREQKVAPETPFIIGSLSKSFTALASMQLVEAGKLELDATVQEYLPWFTMAGNYDAGEITVHHLLVQTSGIPNLAGVTSLAESNDRSMEEEVRDLSATELVSEPGETYIYSNANYLILGLIIEAISGQGYSEYVRSQIFDPLNMENSYLSRQEGESGGMASGHVRWFGLTRESRVQYLDNSLPAGFIISSAGDMCRYLQMYLNQGSYNGTEVLSKDSIEAMFEPGVTRDDGGGYGMGLLKKLEDETTIINHDGSTQGFNAGMAFSPEEQWGVVILTNTSGQIELPASAITMGLAELLRGNELDSISRFPFIAYLVLFLTILGFLALAIRSTILLPQRWGKMLQTNRPRGLKNLFRRVILPVALELLVPFVILVYIPAGAGFPVWRLLALFHPDLVYGLLLLAYIMLAKALWRAFIAIRIISTPGRT